MNTASHQRFRLMEALREGPVSTIYARQHLDVLHPAARVQELREEGHRIVTHWTDEENHRVAKYVLLASAFNAHMPRVIDMETLLREFVFIIQKSRIALLGPQGSFRAYSLRDFRNYYAAYRPVIKVWMGHPQRKTVDCVQDLVRDL